MKKLRAYMVWAGPHPEDGAVLAWAYNRQQARALIGRVPWVGCEWIDIRARWLRGCTHKPLKDGPHVIDRVPVCESCELWGEAPLSDDGFCGDCQEAVEMEAAG